MKIIDISWPISSDMTAYKDKKTVNFRKNKTFEKDGSRDSLIFLGSHTGTHVDSPAHFLQDGKTIENLDLKNIVGPCVVLDCTDVKDAITATDLQKHVIKEGQIVLLKTKNSVQSDNDPFDVDFVYLEKSGAQYLVEKKIKAVAIDYLGLERGDKDHPAHKLFMKNNIAIVEGVRLAGVAPVDYFFCCLPLKLVGLEAAPARVILIENFCKI